MADGISDKASRCSRKRLASPLRNGTRQQQCAFMPDQIDRGETQTWRHRGFLQVTGTIGPARRQVSGSNRRVWSPGLTRTSVSVPVGERLEGSARHRQAGQRASRPPPAHTGSPRAFQDARRRPSVAQSLAPFTCASSGPAPPHCQRLHQLQARRLYRFIGRPRIRNRP